MFFHWYGFMIGMAIVIASYTADYVKNQLARQHQYSFLLKNSHHGLLISLLVGGLMGARAYHVIDQWAYYQHHFEQIFYLWQGGLGIIGGMMGGIIGFFISTQVIKLSFWQKMVWLDLVALVMPVGQMIGRWANYFNQELYGLPTSLPWGIYIKPENRLRGYEQHAYFHPLFAYESVACGIIFMILWLKYKNNKQIFGKSILFQFYLVLYFLARFWLEFLRINPWRWGVLTVAQWAALFIFIMFFIKNFTK